MFLWVKAMNCDNCEKKNEQISKLTNEMEKARLERINFALLMALILTVILLFASCVYFLKFKSEMIKIIMWEENENGIVVENSSKCVNGGQYDFDYYYP